ncbi:MAG: type II toxin-antitoxin system Phd/YefM family antitoxin [Caulobacter sp.]|nr:type II toxin-antitoxin system Phd/YefM family antitoxin [Caulobacter sp.]
MREVGASKVRTHFSALLAEIEAGGDPVVITRRGKPAAQLSPIPKAEQSDSLPNHSDAATNDLRT